MKKVIQESESTGSGTVLIVDDTPKNLKLLSDILDRNGYNVSTAINGKMALEYLKKNQPDIILLDIKMPEMDGFELCRRVKATDILKDIPIIFVSALDAVDDKITAFKMGGVDYITKPFQVEEVLARVNTQVFTRNVQDQLKYEIVLREKAQQNLQNAYDEIEIKVLERTAELKRATVNLKQEIQQKEEAETELRNMKNRLQEEVVYLQEEIKINHNFDEIISQDKSVKSVLKQIEQVAPSDTTVLILGETGTGKELVARAIHNLSRQSNRPLVKVNCAAIPSNLIESELFGHEKGAFTGAIAKKIGRFELANNGTIFLDEIGDLQLDLQAKLLRVLQEGEFERLGSSKTQKISVRVLAATNRNLNEQRKKGLFRDDLFYRLNVFPIESPPLRERKDDIPLLVRHFIEKFNKKMGKNIEKISSRELNILQTYHWPGNIRELENVIERAAIVSQDNQLQLGDWLSKDVKSLESSPIATLDEMQKEHILYALELAQGKVSGDSGAAKLLGLKSTTLDARIKKLGIKLDKSYSSIM